MTKIFQLKGLKPPKEGHANFYECCDLTEKVYLVAGIFAYPHTIATTFIAHMAGHKSFNPSLRPQNYILGNSSRTIQSELKKKFMNFPPPIEISDISTI